MEETSEHEEVDTATNCAVCLEEYKHRTNVLYLNLNEAVKVCDHKFCQECIVNWIRTNHSKTCPLCRRSLIYENIQTDTETDMENDSVEEYESSTEDLYSIA